MFTGDGSDVPLAIANARPADDPLHQNASPALREHFAQYVHAEIKKHVPSIPDFGEDWIRCVFAGQLLDRHLLQEGVTNFLTSHKWTRTNGGFVVPRGVFSF